MNLYYIQSLLFGKKMKRLIILGSVFAICFIFFIPTLSPLYIPNNLSKINCNEQSEETAVKEEIKFFPIALIYLWGHGSLVSGYFKEFGLFIVLLSDSF